MMRIPYTGSGILASALAMNKLVSRQIFMQSRPRSAVPFRSAPRRRREMLARSTSFSPPVVIKPCQEGSSVGVTIVSDDLDNSRGPRKAFAYGGGILIEEYIRGREIQVGILDDVALGAIEIVPK